MLGKRQIQQAYHSRYLSTSHAAFLRGRPALSLQILSCEFFRTVSRLCGKQPVL